MAGKPQLVLLPGAWLTPDHYVDLITKLKSHGYRVHVRQLPSVGSPRPPTDFARDTEVVQALVKKAIGHGDHVVVLPHSWAGILAGGALVGLSKQEREAEGKKGGIIRAGYICAFMVEEGKSLVDSVAGPESWWDVKEPYIRVKTPGIFYTGLTDEQKKHWHSLQLPHAFATFNAKSTGTSWMTIPTSYLLCELDEAIPGSAQERMSEGVKAAGGDIEITKIRSGHSPFLSHLDETVDWIRSIAGEKVQTKKEGTMLGAMC